MADACRDGRFERFWRAQAKSAYRGKARVHKAPRGVGVDVVRQEKAVVETFETAMFIATSRTRLEARGSWCRQTSKILCLVFQTQRPCLVPARHGRGGRMLRAHRLIGLSLLFPAPPLLLLLWLHRTDHANPLRRADQTLREATARILGPPDQQRGSQT